MALVVGLVGAASGLECGARESAGAPPANVLILSADSLRFDRLQLWSGSGVETPALAALAERGSLFRGMWAVAPWTAPSMVSTFTGLYPPSHGAIARDDTTPAHLVTLPRLAEERGYRLGNFSFFSGISYFRNLGLPPPVAGMRHGREPALLAGWLDEEAAVSESSSPAERRPFFAWIHLLEPHLPYGATGYRAKELRLEGSSGLEAAQLAATVPVGTVEFVDGDRERLLQLYDADITELDLRVAEIVEVLAERGLSESTLIVFVADHGEELLEHGWIGHASTAIEAKLVPEILRIPLLIAGTGVEVGEVRDEMVQHVDLLPTVVGLLDWEAEPSSDGRALFSAPWASSWRLFSRRPPRREYAFFDSSVGGNLTPEERREERLQGVTDGDCLLRVHSAPGMPERHEVVALAAAACDESGLAEALAGWQKRQLQQRLEILQTGVEEDAPAADEITSYREELEILAPVSEAQLAWGHSSGLLALEWSGGGEGGWVEYRVGSGPLAVTGLFRAEQSRIVFGPFPEGFWNDLAGYSPFRFRAVDDASRLRSPWREFTVLDTRDDR